MRIESIKKSDLLICADIYVKIFNEPPWNDKWTRKAAYVRLNNIYNTPRFYGIKYIASNQIKGALFGNIEAWYKNYHYQLKEMFVKSELQRSGIGSKLLKYAEKVLEKKKVQTIYLSTSSKYWVSNFYRKNKYRLINDLQFMIKDIKKKNVLKKKA
jgi:aminoglycoside 6'-N-acetyltransferase I